MTGPSLEDITPLSTSSTILHHYFSLLNSWYNCFYFLFVLYRQDIIKDPQYLNVKDIHCIRHTDCLLSKNASISLVDPVHHEEDQ